MITDLDVNKQRQDNKGTDKDMTLPLTLKEVRGQTLQLHGCFKFYTLS